MYQELYNDLLPIDELKKIFTDYFVASTPSNIHNIVRENIDEKLDDNNTMYVLLPTNVENYELVQYIKQSTNVTGYDIFSMISTDELYHIQRAYYTFIENSREGIFDAKQLEKITGLLDIDPNKLIKGNKINKLTPEYKKFKNWLKDAPIDPSYSPFTKENRNTNYNASLPKAFAEKLSDKLGVTIDTDDFFTYLALEDLISLNKPIESFTELDINTFLINAKMLNLTDIVNFGQIAPGESFKQLLSDNDNLRVLYEIISERLSKQAFELDNDIYHQEMRAFLAEKYDLSSDDELDYLIERLTYCTDYMTYKKNVGGFHSTDQYYARLICTPIDEKFSLHVVIHEMVHAMSTIDVRHGYMVNEDSRAFNEIVTDYLATALTLEARSKLSTDQFNIIDNLSSYRRGIEYFSTLLSTFHEEICRDFSNPSTAYNCLEYAMGSKAYEKVIILAKDYLNFDNVSLFNKIISQLNINVYNDTTLVEHLDEIKNHKDYNIVKDDIERYLDICYRINDPTIQLSIKRKQLNNIALSGNQEEISRLQNKIAMLEARQAQLDQQSQQTTQNEA